MFMFISLGKIYIQRQEDYCIKDGSIHMVELTVMNHISCDPIAIEGF